MSHEMINPNWHAVLLHFPLALLATGVLIEIVTLPRKSAAIRLAGRWMILLGSLAAIPVVTTGIYAFHDAMKLDGGFWYESRTANAIAANPAAWELMWDHILLNSIATGLAAAVIVIYIACSDKWRGKLYWVLLAAMVAALGLMLSGAWHGGEAVYRYGVAQEPPPAASAGASADHDHLLAWLMPYLPPIQLHVLLAGATVSLALIAFALAVRAMTRFSPFIPAHSGDDLAAMPDQPGPAGSVLPAHVPAPRFWLLAALVAVLAALAGVWLAGTSFREIPKIVKGMTRDDIRLPLHIIFGGGIIVLCLLLAALARWAWRSRIVLAIFSVLLAVAVAGQIWLGILLMYDGGIGSPYRFNRDESAKSTHTPAPPVTNRPG